MIIAFILTLTNECKHVMKPYCVNKSKFCAQLKTNYLSVRFKVDRITQSYNG